MADPALSLYYKVELETDSGKFEAAFTSCDGLGAEYEVLDYAEGGENSYVHRIPGRMKYTPIKLTRPIDDQSGKLAHWFTTFKTGVTRQKATVTVYDGNNKQIAQWALRDVFPVRWTGPSLTSDGSQVAKETLELAHNGFL